MSEGRLNYLEREDKVKNGSYSIISKYQLKIGNMEELEGKDIHQANHLNWIDELNHQIIEEDTVGCLAKKNLGLFLT